MAITRKAERRIRKRYNKMKQINRLAEHLIRDIAVCYVDRLDGCVLVDLKKKYIVKPTEALIGAVSRPHQWSCFISVFGRTQIDEYMKSEQIITPAKYYQEDLAPVFEEHHKKLIESVPEHHRCGVGWIASPQGIELTEKQAGEIFEKLEAWA